jgi:hypothetical protein
MWKQDALSIVDQVKELITPKCLLANFVRIEYITDLENLILKQIQLYAHSFAKVLNSETLNLH